MVAIVSPEQAGRSGEQLERSGAEAITIDDFSFVYKASFVREGDDLVLLSDEGRKVTLEGYFLADKPPDLISPDGAILGGETVALLSRAFTPIKMAQSGDLLTDVQLGQASEPVGQVETVSGSAVAVRQGQVVTLQVGAAVFEGDVLETGENAELAITFTDGTVFSLSPNARMTLNDYLFAAVGGDSSFAADLLQGTFVFITGEIAPRGDFLVTTPVALIGIRGTTPVITISAIDGATEFSIAPDPDGTIGSYSIINRITGQIEAVVDDQTRILSIQRPDQQPVVREKTAEELADEIIERDKAYQAYSQSRERLQRDNQDNQDDPQDQQPEPSDPQDDQQGEVEDGEVTQVASEPESAGEPLPDPLLSDGDADSDPDLDFSQAPSPGSDGSSGPAIRSGGSSRLEPAPVTKDATTLGSSPSGGETQLSSNLSGQSPTSSGEVRLSSEQDEEPAASSDEEALGASDPTSDSPTVISDPVVNENNPPVVTGPLEASAVEDGPSFQIDLLSGASDPDGDPLFVSSLQLITGNALGVAASGPNLAVDPSLYDFLEQGELETITYDYLIEDGAGGAVGQSVSIVITGVTEAPENLPPLVSGPLEAAAVEGEPSFQVDLLSGASDPDGDALLISNLQLLVGDDSGVSVGLQSLTVDPSSYAFLGQGDVETITYEYLIEDGVGGTVEQTVSIVISGVNSAPELQTNLGLALPEGGDALVTSARLQVIDVDDSPAALNFSITQGPVAGLLLLDGVALGVGDGFTQADVDSASLAYQHDGSQTLSDSFEFTISDDGGLAVAAGSPQSFTIAVSNENDAPIVDGPLSVSFSEDDAPFQIDLLAGTSDPDGDQLLVSNLQLLSGDGSGLTFDGNHILLVDPAAYNSLATDAIETIGYSYSVSDGQGGNTAQSLSVTVNGENDAPVTVADSATTVEDIPISIAVLANDTDPDGDTLTLLSATASEGAVVIETNGQLTYTPPAGFQGGALITYVVGDNRGGQASGSVSVSVLAGLLLTIEQFVSGSFDTIFDQGFFSTTTTASASSGFELQSSINPDLTTQVTGTGFTFDGDGKLSGGTLETVVFLDGGDVIAQATGFLEEGAAFQSAVNAAEVGDRSQLDAIFDRYTIEYDVTAVPGPVTIEGGAQDDLIEGGSGNDSISGFGGNDQLFGFDGNDTLVGGAGDDLLEGGAGVDDLEGGIGADTLVGGPGADNIFWALGDGFDALLATGDDTGGGLAGDIVLIDGSFFDINWTFDNSDLTIGPAIDGNYDFADTGGLVLKDFRTGADSVAYMQISTSFDFFYSNVSPVRLFVTNGSSGLNQPDGTEILLATSASDTIDGGGGFRDYLYGFGGDDFFVANDATRMEMRGGAGNDTMNGGVQDDRLAGGPGDDIFNGGDGVDLARYDRDGFPPPSGVVVNLITGIATDSWGDTDQLTSIEDVRGTPHADSIVGNDVRNRLTGYEGDDTLEGGAGDDLFRGGAGNDVLIGDPDDSIRKVAYYRDEGGAFGIQADLSVGSIIDSYGDTDSISLIDNVGGTDLSDTFIGNNQDNYFHGYDGSDSYDGLGGNDDGVAYWEEAGPFGVVANLATGVGTDTWGNSESYSNIERIFGSSRDDSLTGDALGNDFFGIGGDDTIDGAGGFDFLRYDQDFREELYIASQGVTVDLPGNTATDSFGFTDILFNIEGVRGGDFGDLIQGGSENNSFIGGFGDDTLIGGAGADTLEGNEGDDSLTGGAGADDFLYRADILNEASFLDQIADFEVGTDRLTLQDGAAIQSATLDGNGNTEIVLTSSPSHIILLQGVEETDTNLLQFGV